MRPPPGHAGPGCHAARRRLPARGGCAGQSPAQGACPNSHPRQLLLLFQPATGQPQPALLTWLRNAAAGGGGEDSILERRGGPPSLPNAHVPRRWTAARHSAVSGQQPGPAACVVYDGVSTHNTAQPSAWLTVRLVPQRAWFLHPAPSACVPKPPCVMSRRGDWSPRRRPRAQARRMSAAGNKQCSQPGESEPRAGAATAACEA